MLDFSPSEFKHVNGNLPYDFYEKDTSPTLNANAMRVPGRAPSMKFQRRSLSAREPSEDRSEEALYDQFHKLSVSKTPRMLPATPGSPRNQGSPRGSPRASISHQDGYRKKSADEREYARPVRNSWTPISAAEKTRQYRSQLTVDVDDDYSSGSHSKTPSPRNLPIPGFRSARSNSASRCIPSKSANGLNQLMDSPKLNHLDTYPESMSRPRSPTYPINSNMGQANGKDMDFSTSFDCAYSPPTMHKPKPVTSRVDSTTSEDGLNEMPTEEKPSKELSGSSASLQIFNSKKNKFNKENKTPQRYRSSTSCTKFASSKSIAMSPTRKAGSLRKLPNISASSQAIILFCMENAKRDIANRVISRLANKREDFAQFCTNLAPEQWQEFTSGFREYLNGVVKHVHSSDKIREISIMYGVSQVSKRSLGFKADFFAGMADALTTECVFLDGATHQPTEAIEAWSELVELMFSNIRDGYYQQIRFLRRNSHCFYSFYNQSSDLSTDGSDLQTPASHQGFSRQNSNESHGTPPSSVVQQPMAAPGVVIRF